LALGCWFFTLEAEEPTTLRSREFFSRVRGCLTAIDGVSDVTIHSMPTEEEDTPVEFSPVKDPRYGQYVGPHWMFEWIDFAVHLSHDEQRRLLLASRSVHNWSPVDFRVLMTYRWAMPISCLFIEKSLDEDTSTPSVAVYRYLLEQTARDEDGIRFACVPPVFARADVFLEPVDPAHMGSSTSAFSRVAHSVHAGRRYDIGFDPERCVDPVAEFLHAVGSELDLYYQIVHAEGERMHEWESVQSLVDDLTELRRRKGIRGTMRRFLGSGRITGEAIIRLMHFAAQDHRSEADFRRQLRNLYAAGEQVTFIPELVDAEFADREQYPVEQFSRLVQVYQEQRLTDREMLVVATASLLGGAVGAAATLLAGA
jgi:hypothetical protein